MNYRVIILLLIASVISLMLLMIGPSAMPFSEVLKQLTADNSDNIIWLIRIPKIFTSFFAGAALGVCGVLMQTYFHNPLAGPFVLGISSGSSLGVALWIMASSYLPSFLYRFGMTSAAIVGALAVLFMMVIISHRFNGKFILLVMGLVFGYFASGIINLFVVLSNAHQIKSYLVWTLGSFNRIVGFELFFFIIFILFIILISFTLIRSLNALSLGDEYAQTMGINLKKIRKLILIITALLTGLVTAYCGPIAFLGIIVPHLVRAIFKTGDHRLLLPMSVFVGGGVAQLAELVSTTFPLFNLPINAVMGLVGAPVIVFFMVRNQKRVSHE